MLELLPRDSLIAALKGAIPDAEWVIRHLEKSNGWLQFPPVLVDTIKNLKIEQYPLIYEDERLLTYFSLRAWLTDQEIRELAIQAETASLEQRGEFLKEICDAVEPVLESIPKTPEQIKAAQELFASLSENEQREAIKRGQAFYSVFFASFGQTFSMMMHGEKLTTLIAKAKAGDDDAFCKAIRIDGRILTVVPYFREKYERAKQLGESAFLDKVSVWTRAAPYRGRIRHKSLWVVFALLDQAGMLANLSHREILDICDEVGVGGAENRIEDVGYLSKRLREYRKLQKSGVASTP
ncbi:hypothetical protein [Nevskia sp.]|uniref:hypothetical protein n=1 Tax=Nevskia sp. TaxID=1929292 RepID=UPI0025F3707B|nr:hypothetical protein [Nevskia sp.]